MKVKAWQISLTIALLSLGFLLSVQFRTQQVMVNDLKMQKTDDLLAMVKKLYEKRSDLIHDLWDLRGRERNFEADKVEGKALSESMQQEYTDLQIASGVVDIEGPGITISLPPRSGNQYYYYQDVAFLANELFNVNAEAVAINDHRVITTTAISEDNSSQKITIDGEPLDEPIVVKAIGDPESLKAVSIAGGYVDRLKIEFNIPLIIKEEPNLLIPKAGHTTYFNYAQETKE